MMQEFTPALDKQKPPGTLVAGRLYRGFLLFFVGFFLVGPPEMCRYSFFVMAALNSWKALSTHSSKKMTLLLQILSSHQSEGSSGFLLCEDNSFSAAFNLLTREMRF